MNNTMTGLKVVLTGDQAKTIQAAIKAMGKSKLPILNQVKFYTVNNELHMAVTDTDNYIDLCLQNNMENEGSFLLSYTEIKGIKANKQTSIELEQMDNSTLKINVNGMQKTIKTLDVEDYPREMDLSNEEPKTDTLNSEYISAICDSVPFAAHTQTRPILTGVYHNGGNVITCDSHRLFKRTDMYNLDNITEPFLIRQETVKHVQNLMKKEKQININVYDKFVQYSNDTIRITGRLLEGTYPDVSRIIPQYFKQEFTIIHKADIIPVLEQIKKDNTGKNCVCKLTFEDNKTMVISSQTDNGTLQSIVPIKDLKSVEIPTISFNASYLLDCLKQLNDNEVNVSIMNATSPCVITDSKNYHLVLPIRTY